MIPALQFDNWQWLALNAATPVVLWGAFPFHKAAWQNLKHGTATMDTLVSLGVLAAWLWRLYALIFGDAGMPDMRMGFDLIPEQGRQQRDLPRDRRRSSRRSSSPAATSRPARSAAPAPRSPHCWSSAPRKSPCETAARSAIEELKVGDDFVVRPGEKVATDGIVVEGNSAVDMSLLTGESVPVEVGPGRRRRRRDRQRRRPPGRPRREGRQGHRARPDRQARHRRAVRQGARCSGSRTASRASSSRS